MRAAALSIQASLAAPSELSARPTVGIDSTDGRLGMPSSASIVRSATAARTPPKRPAEYEPMLAGRQKYSSRK